MMRVLALAVMSLGLQRAFASPPARFAGPNSDGIPMRALFYFGKFCREHNIPVPWMNLLPSEEFRRLSDDTLAIPAACATACPGIDGLVSGLKSKMTTAMEPHMNLMAMNLMASPANGSIPSPAELAAKMEAMRPFFAAVMDVLFADLCSNRASYECMKQNMQTCQPPSSNMTSVGMSFDNPLSITVDYGDKLECFCGVCPASRKAFTDMVVSQMSFLITAFSAFGSSMNPSNASGSQVGTDVRTMLLNGFCPVVPVMRCWEAYPSQCSKMVTGQGMQGLGAIGVGGDSNITTVLKQECDAAGVSTSVIATGKVTKRLTFKGLDFSKVMGDSAIKAELIATIKKAYLARLTGYTAEDLAVTLKSGSVVATVEITTMPGSSADNLKASMATVDASAVLAEIKKIDNISAVLEKGKTTENPEATTNQGKTTEELETTTDAPDAPDAPSFNDSGAISGSSRADIMAAIVTLLAYVGFGAAV